jgi:enoyl-CoA hydratase
MNAPIAAPTFETLLYEKKSGIAIRDAQSPKVLNALSRRTWEDLRAAFEDARRRGVRGVVLTGADKAFIAGRRHHSESRTSRPSKPRAERLRPGVLDLTENLGSRSSPR